MNRAAVAKPTSVVEVFDRQIPITLLVVGLVEYLPAGYLIVTRSAQIPAGIMLTWLIPMLAWLATWAIRPMLARATAQSVIGLLYLALPVLFLQDGGTAWMPLPFVAFAIALGAALCLPVASALVVIVLSAALNFIALFQDSDQVILAAADLAGRAVGPLFILITAPPLLLLSVSWRREAQISDRRAEQIEEAAAATYRSMQVRSAKTAVDRRIHETVLNTLNAIAQGSVRDIDLLRSECRRDVEQLDLGAPSSGRQSLSSVISEAEHASGLRTPELIVRIDADPLLDATIAAALRDAVVEALRNVERHARARTVRLTAFEAEDGLRIEIADDGIGLATGDYERFGVRNTIRASMTALGGDAEISSVRSGGTLVELRVPVATDAELYVPVDPIVESLFRRVPNRVYVMAPMEFGLVMLPWLAGGLAGRGIVFAVAYLAYAGANIGLAAVWGTRRRLPMAGLAVLLGLVAYFTASLSLEGCASASSVHWIINSVSGGLGLILFATYGRRWYWLILPSLTLAAVALTIALPADCRAVPTMSIVVTIAYMGMVMFTIGLLFSKFDAQRAQAIIAWTGAVEQQAEIERQLVVTAQWTRVSGSTRLLLANIAEGDLDPTSPDVRERAASEEAQLRANLGMQHSAASALWREVIDLVEFGTARGISVDAAAIVMPETDLVLPSLVHAHLEHVIHAAPSRSVSLRLFSDDGCPELLCLAPAAAFTAGLPLPDRVDGWVIELNPAGVEQSSMSIRWAGR